MNADMKRLCEVVTKTAMARVHVTMEEEVEAVVRAVLTELTAMAIIKYHDSQPGELGLRHMALGTSGLCTLVLETTPSEA